jgi:hypothetical protein
VSPITLFWLFIAGAGALAVWVLTRFPERRPKTLHWALLAFLAAQVVPNLGLAVLPAVLRLPYGPQVVLLAVVLPVFFALFVTVGWLVRAGIDAVGGPRGGHPVRSVRAHSQGR